MSEENKPQIKRKYGADDFNPYQVGLWLFENVYFRGPEARVFLVGKTERFNEHIIKGLMDALKDKGVPSDDLPVVGQYNGFVEFTTHHGTVVRIASLEDAQYTHAHFEVHCKWANYIGLCYKYQHPSWLNIVRAYSKTKSMYSFYDLKS